MRFGRNEAEFLGSREDARIATSHGGIPHVKPVSYIMDGDAIIVATDYDTRTYRNIMANPNVAVTVDVYSPGRHRAVLVQGQAEVIRKGSEFQRLYGIFHQRFEWVRRDPWKEGEAPFLRIIPGSGTSWGLGTAPS